MEYTLKNDKVAVVLSSRGGEPISMKGADGVEYIWQADPTYWKSHAPHLFPYVGRFTEGKYIMDGEVHEMGIHGFFRGHETEAVDITEDSVSFVLTDDEELRRIYDRSFKATIKYTLVDTTLKMSFIVENTDTRTMYFGYGGHPGFNAPLVDGLAFEDYYLEFGNECQPTAIGLSPTCFLQGANTPLPIVDDKKIPLVHNLFDNDAVVMRAMDPTITLKSDKDSHGVTVTYPQMPYLGLWHAPKTEAPYVCIEPWVSLPSRQDVIEVFEDKLDMIVLAAGKTYVNDWAITVF